MALIDPQSQVTPHQQSDTSAPCKTPVRVLVVEDEDSARLRLSEVIRSDTRLQLGGEANQLASAKRWLADGRRGLDVLLVDLGLPDGSGLELISECSRLRPEVAILVMTMFGDERHVFEALERGASGYLLKSTPASAIAEHILDLHAGGSPITPTVARLILKRMSAPAASASLPASGSVDKLDNPTPLLEPLSARELDVLNQIAVGYNTAEIAQRLNISTHTVTAHIRHVYQKLQVRSRSAAVFEGQRRGLIRPSTP